MELSERFPKARAIRFRTLDVVSLWFGLAVWVATFMLGTLPNAAVLGLLAALLATLGAKVRPDSDAARPSALLRGFVYLFVLAGLLLLGDDPPTASSHQLYACFAGLVFLLAFVVSYRPALSVRLHRRVRAMGTRRERS